MYKIFSKSTSVNKELDELLNSLSLNVRSKCLKRLATNPFIYGNKEDLHGKVEKKGKYYCYEITSGDRIYFDIIRQVNAVCILFAGNHDAAALWLRKNRNKRW